MMDKLEELKKIIEKVYLENSEKLLFHGWHHITFVRKKSLEFGKSINANLFIVESAALVHDLNYIVRPNSEPEEGKEYREKLLTQAGYSEEEIKIIEKVIMEAHTRTRGHSISEEGKALSDADALFKVLPITPILFASRYIIQNQVDISKMAHKVTSEQNKLLNEDIYFYTELAKKYLKWTKTNLELWNSIEEALEDPDVKEMLSIAYKLKVI